MISYYYYWQALNQAEESLKTVAAMQPDVPPMVQAQHEMNMLELDYFREEAEKFTKRLLIFFGLCIIIGILYSKGFIDVQKLIG
jgi:hypothetical protein